MNNKGFTMIELLIVVAIFSLILTGLTIAFIQQQRLSNFTQEAIDVDQTGRTALDYIASIVRNATARQGKTFSLGFESGGSTADPRCEDNTGTAAGSVDNTPDCLTIFTWDITRGEFVDPVTNERKFPSTAASISLVSAGPPLVLQLPQEWFPPFVTTPLIEGNVDCENGDLLGFRSRINLCTLDSTVSCVATPNLCTECATILRVKTVDSATRQATICDGVDAILEQNFQEDDFADMNTFINNFFLPSIATLSNEMTIVQAQTFTIDPADRQLLLRQNEAGSFQPISGPLDVNNPDASGIVDLQFVFNLQRADGGMTKVGVPLDAANCRFPNFDELENEIVANPTSMCRSGEKDIRTVEIYLLVRSRVRPTLVQGKFTPLQSVPAIGDVLERDTNHASLGEGFMYRIFSTVVYIRNMAREEFG